MRRRAGADAAAAPLGWLVPLLALGQVALWGLAFGLSYSAPEIDSAEQFVWAFSLENGYWKHPPAPSWILHAVLALIGPSVALPFVLAQLCIVSALALTWRLGCEFMAPRRALIATVLTSLVTYHNLGGDNFNHSTALLPFQAATVLWFFLATRHGGLHRWGLVGLFAGLAMLVKYVALMPIAGLLAIVVIDRRLHRRDVAVGLALAVFVFGVTLLPHAIWLHRTDFLPFRYAQSVAQAAPGLGGALQSVFEFLTIQAVRLLPFALGCWLWMRGAKACAARSASPAQPPTDATTSIASTSIASSSIAPASIATTPFATTPIAASPTAAAPTAVADRRFLLIAALAPLVLTLVFALATRTELQSRWGTNAFLLSGLAVFAFYRGADSAPLLRKAIAIAFVIQAVLAVASTFGRTQLADSLHRRTRATFPGAVLAREAHAVWSAHTDAPLRIVVSDIWLGGNVVAHSPRRVAVLIDGRLFKSPWVREEAIEACGALVLDDLTSEGKAASNPALDDLMARASATGVWNLPWGVSQREATARDVGRVRWGVIEPGDPSRCELR